MARTLKICNNNLYTSIEGYRLFESRNSFIGMWIKFVIFIEGLLTC